MTTQEWRDALIEAAKDYDPLDEAKREHVKTLARMRTESPRDSPIRQLRIDPELRDALASISNKIESAFPDLPTMTVDNWKRLLFRTVAGLNGASEIGKNFAMTFYMGSIEGKFITPKQLGKIVDDEEVADAMKRLGEHLKNEGMIR